MKSLVYIDACMRKILEPAELPSQLFLSYLKDILLRSLF